MFAKYNVDETQEWKYVYLGVPQQEGGGGSYEQTRVSGLKVRQSRSV